MLLHTTLLLKTLGEPRSPSVDFPCSSLPLYFFKNNIYIFFNSLSVFLQEDTPGGSTLWTSHLAPMNWTLTLYSGRGRGRGQAQLPLQSPVRQWPNCRSLWEACGLFSAPCSSGAFSPSLRGGSPPASSPPHFSAFSTTSISWQHSIHSLAVTPRSPAANGELCLTDWGPAGLPTPPPPLNNDCLYDQSSWFSLQCFLNWWLVFTPLILFLFDGT